MSTGEQEGAADLKSLLRSRDPDFYRVLRVQTQAAVEFDRALSLNTMRRRAAASGMATAAVAPLRIAIVGGASLRPFADLLEHFTATLAGYNVLVWTGDYDNYTFEIVDSGSELYAFKPEVVLLLPSEGRCRFTGSSVDPLSRQQDQANEVVDDLIGLCKTAHENSGAEVVLGNLRLPPAYDPGPARHTSLISDYGFRKYVNMQLGFKIPHYVHLLDVEFLANRLGTLRSIDERTWFESKQPFSMELAVSVAREFSQIVYSMRHPAKKVVVLDLDNTLWEESLVTMVWKASRLERLPSREAFRSFQEYLLSLTERGVLLAVCSKNDHERAIEPFVSHPEMVLRLANIVTSRPTGSPNRRIFDRLRSS